MEESQEGLTNIQKKIILLTYADKTPIIGKVRLYKGIFLISKIIRDLGKETKYVSHKFGPFSDPVKSSFEHLVKSKILFIDENKIYVTPRGEYIAKGLESEEEPATIELIMECKDFLDDLTIDELLCYIYSIYPEIVEKSEEYSRIKLKTEDILLDLIQKEKLSIGRTAELLDKNISYIIKRLNKRGHQILQ